MINGILIVNKPCGITSFDVVRELRKILNEKTIGHGGTLDPMATGVLPIFIGKATKIINLIDNHDKTYIAGFKLGLTTDTQDIEGKVIINQKSQISLKFLNDITKSFLGKIKQIPPMYSAVKINGQRLYNLARKGKEIERTPREIEIYNIKILNFNEKTQEGTIQVEVSKGTYIRTLINDIGMKLNVGATLTSLKRIKAMGLTIEKSHDLNEIAKFKLENKLDEILIDIDKLLTDHNKLYLEDETIKQLFNGRQLKIGLIGKNSREIYRLYDKKNQFIGVGYNKDNGFFKIKILN